MDRRIRGLENQLPKYESWGEWRFPQANYYYKPHLFNTNWRIRMPLERRVVPHFMPNWTPHCARPFRNHPPLPSPPFRPPRYEPYRSPYRWPYRINNFFCYKKREKRGNPDEITQMSLCKKSTSSIDKDRMPDKSTLSLIHLDSNDNEVKTSPNDQIKPLTVLGEETKDNRLTYSCHTQQTVDSNEQHLYKGEIKDNKSEKGEEIHDPTTTEEKLDDIVEKLESVFQSSQESVSSSNSCLEESKMLVKTTSKTNIELNIIDEDRTSLSKTCTSTRPINIKIDLKRTPVAKVRPQSNTSSSKFQLKKQIGRFTQEEELEQTSIRIETKRDNSYHVNQEEKLIECIPKNVDSFKTFSDGREDREASCCKTIISHREETAINIDNDSQSSHGDNKDKDAISVANLSTRLSDFEYFESLFYNPRMVSENNYALLENVIGLESPKNFWKKQIQMRIFDDRVNSSRPIHLEISRCQEPPETDPRVPPLIIDYPNTETITATTYRPTSYSECAFPTIKNDLLNRKDVSFSNISQQLIYLPLKAHVPADQSEIHVSKIATSGTTQSDYKQELLDLLDAAANDLLKKPRETNKKQPGQSTHKGQSTGGQCGKAQRREDTGSRDTNKLQNPEIIKKQESNESSKKSWDVKIFPKKRKKIMVLESSEDEEETRTDTPKNRKDESVEREKSNAKSLGSRQRRFMKRKESRTASKSHKCDATSFEVRSGKEKHISKGSPTKTSVEKKSALNSSLPINVDKYEAKNPPEKSVKAKYSSRAETTQLKPAIEGSLSIVEPQSKPGRTKHCRSTCAFDSDIGGTLNNIQQKYKKRFRDLFGEASDDDDITQIPKYTPSLKREVVKNVNKKSIVTAKLKPNYTKPATDSIKQPKKRETSNVIKPESLKAQTSSEHAEKKAKQNSETTTNKPHFVKIGDKRNQGTVAKSQILTSKKEQLKLVNQSNKILKEKNRSNEEKQVVGRTISLDGHTGKNEHCFTAKTCTSLTTKPQIEQTFKLPPMLDACLEPVNTCDKPEKNNDCNIVQHDLDVIEILPPVPTIDLTTAENYSEESEASIENCFGDMLLEAKQEILEAAEENGIITMYKAQENVTAAEDVEAISASICVGYSTNRTFKEETSSAQETALNQSESPRIDVQCNNTLFKVFVNRSGENLEASISVPTLVESNSNTPGLSDNSGLLPTQVDGTSTENTPEDPSLPFCSKFAPLKEETVGTQMLTPCSSDSSSVARTENNQGSGNNDTDLKRLMSRSVGDFGTATSVAPCIESHVCSSWVPTTSALGRDMTALMPNSDRCSMSESSASALTFSSVCQDKVIHNSAVTTTVCSKNSGTFSSIKELQSRMCKIEFRCSGEPIDNTVEDQTYNSQIPDASTLPHRSPNVNNGEKSAESVNETSKEVIPASIFVDFTTEKRMRTLGTPADLILSSVVEKSNATSVSVGSTAEEQTFNCVPASIKEESSNTTCNDDNDMVDTVNISISSGKVAPTTSISPNAALEQRISWNLSAVGLSQASTLFPSIKEEPADYVSSDFHASDSDNVIQIQCGEHTTPSGSSNFNLEVPAQNPSSSSINSNENVSISKSTTSTLICPRPLASLIQAVPHSILSTEVPAQILRRSGISRDIPASSCPLQYSTMRSLSNLNSTESHSRADKLLSVSEETNGGTMAVKDRMYIVEILSRHLYFIAQLCNVQNVYVETLNRAKFYRSCFKAEIAIFEAQTRSRLNSQALQLFKELSFVNVTVSYNLNTIVSAIMHDIMNNLSATDLPSPLTEALVCLLLRELLIPNGKSYAKIPFFNELMQYCDNAIERMHNNCTRSAPSYAFTEQMHKTLMHQIHQYNRIIANSRASMRYDHGGTNSLLKTNAQKQNENVMHKYRNDHNLSQASVMQPPAIQNRGIIPKNFAFPGGTNTNGLRYPPIHIPQFQSRTQHHGYPQWLNFFNRGIPQIHSNSNTTTENRNHVQSASIQRSTNTQTSLLKPRGNSLDNQIVSSKLLAISNVEPFTGTRHVGPPNSPSPLESTRNSGITNVIPPVSGPVLSPVRVSTHWKKRAVNSKEVRKSCNITNQLVQRSKTKLDIIAKALDGAGVSNQPNLPKTIENESPTRDITRKDPTSIQLTRGISKTTTARTENHLNKEKVYTDQAATEQFICPEKRPSTIDGLNLNLKRRKLHEIVDPLVIQNPDQPTGVPKIKPIAFSKDVTPPVKLDQNFLVSHIDDPTVIGKSRSNSTSIDSNSMDNNIETIDLTRIDGIDTAELQKDIDFVFIKQENEENSVIQDCNGPEEETTITIVHRMCVCGVIANYNCACGDAWYCGEECQLKDWVSHEKVCHAIGVQES